MGKLPYTSELTLLNVQYSTRAICSLARGLPKPEHPSMSAGSTAGPTMMTAESGAGAIFSAIEDVKASLLEPADKQPLAIGEEPSIRAQKSSFKASLRRLERCANAAPADGSAADRSLLLSLPDGGDRMVGSTDAVALSSRRKLARLGDEVHATHGLGVWRAMNAESEEYSATQGLLCGAVGEAVGLLLSETPTGSAEGDHQADRLRTDRDVLVWPDAYTARQSVVRHALAARYGSCENSPLSATMAGPPVVILVEEQDSSDIGMSLDGEGYMESQSKLFQDWRAATLGMTLLSTVLVESHEQIAVAVDAHVAREAARANLAPVLVVLRVEDNSTLSAGLSDLRNVCDFYNAQLHIEGPGLCAVAHSRESRQAVQSLQTLDSAQSFSLDPAAWFGIPCCAVVTLLQSKGGGREGKDVQTIPGLNCLPSLSLGPIAGLWMFLTRMGLAQIRSLVSQTVQLSGDFVHAISSFPNLETRRCGFESTLKISYVMSRSDRLLRKYKAKEQVSKINRCIFDDAIEQCSTLRMTLSYQNDQEWIVFSPAKLLSSGTLWTPGAEAVHQVVDKMIVGTSKYEMSVIGSPVFAHKFGGLPDFHIVDESEAGHMHIFCYGAFRIVPEELSRYWREYAEDVDVVCQLTANMASTLADRLGEIRKSLSPSHTSRRNQKFSSLEGKTKSGKTKSKSAPCPEELPFDFFLHAKNENGAPDFLTVEVRELRDPSHAVEEASLAADIVLSAAEAVCNSWRKSIGAPLRPSSLANVKGLDTFLQLPKYETPAQESASTDRERREGRGIERGALKSEKYSRRAKHSELASDDEEYNSAKEDRGLVHDSVRPKTEDGNINYQHDGMKYARSHFFGSGSARTGSERQGNRKTSRKRRDESGDDDESSEDSGDKYSRRGGGNRGGRGDDSDESEDYGTASEKDSVSEQDDDDIESDADASSGSESDDEEDDRSNATATPRVGLMGWLKGNTDKEIQSASKPSSSDPPKGSKMDSESSEEENSLKGGDSYSTHSDESHSQDISADERSEDSESSSDADEDEKDENVVDESSSEQESQRKPGPIDKPQAASGRFGFNWLSLKVLPEKPAAGGTASCSADSNYSHSTSHSSSEHSDGSEFISEPERMTARGTSSGRASSRRSHYLSESGGHETHSETGESDDSGDGSRGGSRTSRAESVVAPKKSGVMSWFTGGTATAGPSRKPGSPRHSSSSAGSFSSNSSELDEDSDDVDVQVERQHRRTGRPARGESCGSGSVLSWFSGKQPGKQTGGKKREDGPSRNSGTVSADRGNSSRSRRARR